MGWVESGPWPWRPWCLGHPVTARWVRVAPQWCWTPACGGWDSHKTTRTPTLWEIVLWRPPQTHTQVTHLHCMCTGSVELYWHLVVVLSHNNCLLCCEKHEGKKNSGICMFLKYMEYGNNYHILVWSSRWYYLIVTLKNLTVNFKWRNRKGWFNVMLKCDFF